MCCNNNCNTSVNYDSILLLFHNLFLTSDLFSVFSPRFLDNLFWHIEQLNFEHSINALPQWKNEVSNYNCEHQELLNFQFQLTFIPYQLLLTSQEQCQQESIFSLYDQQSNSINNLLLDLSDFHPFFIDPFERNLENFPS